MPHQYHGELTRILEHQLLFPLFQPLVDVQTGQTLGFEALIRGPADSPLHTPAALFDAAERCGLLYETEWQARASAIRVFAKHALPCHKLFLNVSPMALQQPGARRGRTMQLLKQLGIPCNRVVIELSEKYLVTDPEALVKTLRHYQGNGFSIALDDVGAGFSSLQMWSRLTPEIVKLDRYFIAGIDGDPMKQEFVRSMIKLGDCTNSQVVVEGIETRQELDTLITLGMRFGQGYYLGRPARTLREASPALVELLETA